MSESDHSKVFVIIPAYNEENSIGKVVLALPLQLIQEIIVVNNNSSDQTSVVASRAGATVLDENIAGYGRACLKGLAHLKDKARDEDIVGFLDGDFSDFPEELALLIRPIQDEDIDLVIGSRALGNKERGSMTIPQIFGNWLAVKMIYFIYKHRFTDLGPFRAIKFGALKKLKMIDQNYGWTVEMQVKALKNGLKCVEVPVSYRRRIGVSKVSGTVKGTFMAGYKIITTILKYS